MLTTMHILSKKDKRSARPALQGGFTLVELLVVLIIMSVITLVFLNRQSKFDSSTLMRSLAYSIALSVRQAQVYGISVRPQGAMSANFATSHGLYFSNTMQSGYILFADKNSNNSNANKYIVGDDPIDQAFTLNNNFSISEFCVIYTYSGTRTPLCSGSPGAISSIDIMFKRPNPDAIIYAYDNSGNPVTGTGVPATFPTAYIQVQSLDSIHSKHGL